ncbi:chromosome segregation protein SMC [Sorangium cellulosum]|uniref:Chromosome segregation protein SMC n=1 Tax=Sorangium cellulosum TaxID=56 RepID=A0A2L0EKQ7_SORCE|nr:AAA family ATPase [Sorangium cellulosum]AUX39883.1 chromosome segregation protein SMC [Sorangium cellulosum]
MTPQLKRVRVAGFRSIRDAEAELGHVTVLIGPNGAGKSNLLGALTMARMLAFESLQLFVSRRGGATFLMHYGPRQTPVIELTLEFTADNGQHAYDARLGYGADESLLFMEERAGFRRDGQPWRWHSMGAGHRESRLKEESAKHATPRTVHWLLRRINFYHFHDTSTNSPLRTLSNVEQDQYLRSDGSNLAAFLLALRDSPDEHRIAAWKRIQGLVHRVAPFVRELQPVAVGTRGVRLDWLDDRGETFGPAHLSDGTLRAVALLAALAQPPELSPLVSCIDEPELGLHPSALKTLCGLIQSVAAHRQVIVSTQSPAVLDEVAPEDVIVAERKDGATELRRLDPEGLTSWLEEYSLSELYDKNILGGRP